jgi:hypothetical protein
MTQVTETKPMELLKSSVSELSALIKLNAAEGVDVETLALQELEYLRMRAISNPAILDCMPQTVLMAVKTVLKQNLSMDPDAGLVYIKTRNVYVKQPNGAPDLKRTALEIQPSANGLISINRQCGRILDIKNPVVKKNDAGKVIGVSVEILLPSTPSPRWETRAFDESDFERWARASHKENGRYKTGFTMDNLEHANAHYTSWKGGIDPEFARAKAIRHGLKKLGANQNEGRMINITVPIEKKLNIDPVADNAASNEENTYTQFEEVKTESAIKPNQQFNAGDL